MDEAFVGQIELFPYSFAPLYWFLCDGRLLQIAEYDLLYSLIGTKYGGDGRTNFALPDFRGTEPAPGLNYYIAWYGIFPTRD